MTIYLKKIARTPTTFVVILASVNLTIYFIAANSHIKDELWSGWVQAVGSIEAVLVAVWVAWHQAETQAERQVDAAKAELRGMLLSIRTEVTLLRAHVDGDIGGLIRSGDPSTPFLYIFPLENNLFPIYMAFLPKLGMVDNHLRNQIVQTYGAAQSFVSTFRHHNLMVDRLTDAARFSESESATQHHERLQPQRDNLASYSDALRGSLAKVTRLSDELIAMLPTEDAHFS